MTEQGVVINVKKGGRVYIGDTGNQPSLGVREAIDAIVSLDESKLERDGEEISVGESQAAIAIREFVREHGEAIRNSVSGKINDEFSQFPDQAAPFEAVVVAARQEGMTVRAVKRVINDEINYSNLEPEEKSRVGEIIANTMIVLARRDYPIPEHESEPTTAIHEFYR